MVSEMVPIGVGAPSEVRELVRRAAEHTPVVDDALLLASEITTNAIRHGTWAPGDRLTLTISRHRGRLRVGVVGPGPPTPIAVRNEDRPGGFGLDLVDSISVDWQIEPCGEDATRVWFDLAW